MQNRIRGYTPEATDPLGVNSAADELAANEAGEPGSPFDVMRLQPVLKSVETFISSHPALSLGVAVSMGAILGCLVKRR